MSKSKHSIATGPAIETTFGKGMWNNLDGELDLCPCCGMRSSAGEKGQALYFNLIDRLYKVTQAPSNYNRNAAATDLITHLNSLVVTSVSRGLDGSANKDDAIKEIDRLIIDLCKARSSLEHEG